MIYNNDWVKYMHIDTVAIILAAGKGSRMSGNTPKVLQKLAGRSLINHVITAVKQAEINNIICVCSSDSQSLQDEVRKIHPGTVFVVQKKQLGTADAVKAALPAIQGVMQKAVVLYADTPLLQPHTVNEVLSTLDRDTQLAILGFALDKPNNYGKILCDEESNPIKICEYADASEEEKKIQACNSGIMGFKVDVLSELINSIDNNNNKQEYYLTDALHIAVERSYKSRLLMVVRDEVLGVNTIEDLVVCEKIFQNRIRKKMLQNGVMLKAPETVFFSADTHIEQGVIIEPYVTFGNNVHIMDDCLIRSFSYIEGAQIGKGCVIGPYARVRMGTELENNVHIGNFVETKKVHIQSGAKVNHLTYLGDAQIGQNTNIGAGTITCNYDGVKKSTTIIEKNSFIGSNTSLIAPVKIGENVKIGAGSVVDKDVKDNTLVIVRPERIDK